MFGFGKKPAQPPQKPSQHYDFHSNLTTERGYKPSFHQQITREALAQFPRQGHLALKVSDKGGIHIYLGEVSNPNMAASTFMPYIQKPIAMSETSGAPFQSIVEREYDSVGHHLANLLQMPLGSLILITGETRNSHYEDPFKIPQELELLVFE